MLYDVTVDRIQTCGKVIRVEADDREAAERKAMAQARRGLRGAPDPIRLRVLRGL